jgi:hypothetical protein
MTLMLADGAHQRRELPDELAKDRVNAEPFSRECERRRPDVSNVRFPSK